MRLRLPTHGYIFISDTCVCVQQIMHVCVYIYIYTSVDLSLYNDIVSGHIARRSDLKLTDSMFCLCIFSSIFSIDGRS